MRAREFIVEYNRDITLQKLGDRFAAIVNSQQLTSEQAIEALENMDPSANKQYVPWLARQFMQGLFRLEDTNRIRTALQNYNQLKPRLQPDQRDINRLDIHALEDIVDRALNVDISKSTPDAATGTFPVVPKTKVLYNGPLGQLAIPQTKKASCELGRGTRWCTSGAKDNQFEHYSSQAPLYVWRDRNGEKYQLYFGPKEIQIMDSSDRFVGVDQLKSFLEHPILKQIIIPEVQKTIASLSSGTKKDINADMFRFAFQAKTVLPELWNLVKNKISPNAVFWTLNRGADVRDPDIESVMLRDPYVAAQYAKYRLKSRWPEAEPIIARNAEAAAFYIDSFPDEFKNGWPEAEAAIAKRHSGYSNYAREYARRFLNDPDPDSWGQRYIQSQRDRRRKQKLRQRLATKSYHDMKRLGEAGPYQSAQDFAARHPSPSVMDQPTRADQERAQAIEPVYPETWIAPELRGAGAAVRGMAGRRRYDPVDIVDRITPDIMKPTKPFQGPTPEIGSNLKKYPNLIASPAERAAKRRDYVGRETAEKGKQELERLGSFIVNPYDTVVPPQQQR